MFNEYMWKTYLNAGGKDVVKMFEDNFTKKMSPSYYDEILNLHKNICAAPIVSKRVCEDLKMLATDLKNNDFLYGCYSIIDMFNAKNFDCTIENVMKGLYDGLNDTGKEKPNYMFKEFALGITYYSTFLAIEFPEAFIPYYFCYNYNVFEKIAEEFEIEMPEIPVKKDYEGRFFHYAEICMTLWDFRKKHNMSPYELWAFLYDFAPKYIGGTDSYIIKDIPEPKGAYFIGGSKDDIFLDGNEEKITCWQCDPDTRAGDMIVMYLKTPVSAVDSVWRSISVGFNDPFFYYYRCTYIANPVSIKRITQKQLQQDSVFKDVPIVRKNMQGINGVELLPSQYNHLMDIAGADVPRLEFIVSESGQELIREKDVENKLIIPLLKKLGYNENEYTKQLYIEIGNHNHAMIPDFVLLPKHSKGHYSAFALIEAKIKISSQKQLEETKTQARSYAVQLKSKYAAIADKNKIWVLSSDDDYSEGIFSVSWDELNDPDVFSKLLKLIGVNSKNAKK